ncbi:MAG: VWA domain-containing protein [Deltaproteobacteria bacterium]|nr:VWA domain-containing protein [Deltaproteobacteria bacterium]
MSAAGTRTTGRTSAAGPRKRRWPRWLVVGLQYLAAVVLGLVGWWVLAEHGPGWLAALEAEGYTVEHPEMVWALVAIPLFVAIRAHSLSDLPRVQQGLSLLLKSAFVATLVLALVDVQKIETTPKKAATVFVVDVSESVPDPMIAKARDAVMAAWEAANALPEGERPEVRLVVFGKTAQEVALPRPEAGKPAPAFPEIPRLPAGEGAPATNAQSALRLAFGVLPEGQIPRIVMVTDGLETEGELIAEAETAGRFGVPIHYLDLTDVPRPSELMVIRVSVPEVIRARVPFSVTTLVRATAPTKARCEVMLDGVLATTAEHELPAGDTTLDHELKVPDGGDKKVAVSCAPVDATQDRFASNNRYEIPFEVPERPRLLYIEGETRYQKNLAIALQEDFDVELRGARGTPSSLDDAKQFDLIFISDVPRVAESGLENVSSHQMRVLDQYARAGGGLVFAGGENSFGPGGYTQTHLEREVLPVRLDVQRKQDMPGLALMLVIDRSGSMAGPKLDLAKQAAIATLSVLQPDDLLGVCAFDSKPGELVKLQRAANRYGITENVSRLRSGGGTNIAAAIEYAYRELVQIDAKIKHMIVLTDGQSNRAGVIELAQQAALDRITVSTVAVGMGADTELLSRVAQVADGRYYFTNSAQEVPKLFLKETSEVTRKALVEDRFRPKVDPRFRNLQIFRGLDMAQAPSLVGYVSTRAKPRAEVLMTSHIGEPILARWRLGLGKVVVWTSDVKSKWALFWLKWPGYAKFWRQLVRDTMRVETEDPSYTMVADIAGNVLTVGIDAVDDEDRFIDGVTSEVVAVDPDGKEIPVPLTQTAAGRYEGRLALSTYGPYTLRGTHSGGKGRDAEVAYRSFATIAWPFPEEHLVGAPDLGGVKRLAEVTGGIADPTVKQLFDVGGAHTESRVPQWPRPLPYALVFLLADVLLRRVRLYGRTNIAWKDVRGRG